MIKLILPLLFLSSVARADILRCNVFRRDSLQVSQLTIEFTEDKAVVRQVNGVSVPNNGHVGNSDLPNSYSGFSKLRAFMGYPEEALLLKRRDLELELIEKADERFTDKFYCAKVNSVVHNQAKLDHDLIRAVQANNEKLTQQLLDAGADPNRIPSGYYPYGSSQFKNPRNYVPAEFQNMNALTEAISKHRGLSFNVLVNAPTLNIGLIDARLPVISYFFKNRSIGMFQTIARLLGTEKAKEHLLQNSIMNPRFVSYARTGHEGILSEDAVSVYSATEFLPAVLDIVGIDSVNKHGASLLVAAATSPTGALEVTDLLFSRGLKMPTDRSDFLSIAVRRGHSDLVSYYLEVHGVDPHHQTHFDPIAFGLGGAIRDYVAPAKVMMTLRAFVNHPRFEVNRKTEEGRTLLDELMMSMYSDRKAYVPVIRYLISKGAVATRFSSDQIEQILNTLED